LKLKSFNRNVIIYSTLTHFRVQSSNRVKPWSRSIKRGTFVPDRIVHPVHNGRQKSNLCASHRISVIFFSFPSSNGITFFNAVPLGCISLPFVLRIDLTTFFNNRIVFFHASRHLTYYCIILCVTRANWTGPWGVSNGSTYVHRSKRNNVVADRAENERTVKL